MAINLPIISEWNPAGIDKAIADFKKLETKGEKAAFAIKKAAVPAGLAVAALGAVAFDAVKAFAEDDAAAQKLGLTLQNVTYATDAQIASVEQFITKTSIAAAVADDELRPALDKLVRGTGDVAQAQDLLNLALDISAGTGKDLGSVSDALSKAYNGNFTALKKLDPALASLIEEGADADDVFGRLAGTFKNQASTAANTTQGKMKNLGIQMGELKESIGAAVAPLAEKLLPKFLQFSAWIQKNQKLVITLGAIIGGIAVAIVAVNTAMTIWTAVTTAFTAVQAAFNAVMALNPIFLIAVAIAGIIAVLVILQKEFGLFDGVIRVVGESFAAVWGAIKTVFDWVKDNWQLLLVILTGPFGLAFAAINAWKDYIIYVIAVAIGWIKDNWQGLLAIITGPFALAFGAILYFKDLVIEVFNGLKGLAATIFDGIGGAFKGVINAVISNLERGLNAAIKGLNIILDGIDKAAGPWINFGSIPEVSLPRLAEGGIVTSPTIAMIGEGGEPEAVIPLSKLGSMGVGGGGMTVNVNVTSANPNDVVAAIQKWVRNNGQLALASTSGVRF